MSEEWIETSEIEIPKDGKEYLTRNGHQGATFALIRWNSIHNYYQIKGEYVSIGNVGTQWLRIPEYVNKVGMSRPLYRDYIDLVEVQPGVVVNILKDAYIHELNKYIDHLDQKS